MSSNGVDPRNLPKERVATHDEQGKRLWIYTADVKGIFRKYRTFTQLILIAIFLIGPWIKINGHQMILLDVAHRKFALFGVTFWAHDVPILLLVILTFLFTIGFVTTLWGRIWCGWTCPQTVFIDGVFRKIERFIEGDAISRRKLDSSEIGFEKIAKKGIKWILFIGCALVIAHSFLGYFVGTDELLKMVQSNPSENPTSFLIMLSAVALTLFDFAWFREQFCIIMCPYGRFQSVVMDKFSMLISYNSERGEPRAEGGDCVNCFRCVQVCPTGIDIRRGSQLECIACTSCIDACNEVMKRINKPVNLIQYEIKKDSRFARPQSLIYFILLTTVIVGLVTVLSLRKPLDFDLLRAKDTPYQVVDQSVINHFKLMIDNQTFNEMKLRFMIPDNKYEFVSTTKELNLHGGRHQIIDFFVRFPKSELKFGHAHTVVQVESDTDHETYMKEIKLVGPIESN